MEQGKIAAVHSESKWASRHYWGDFDTIFAGSDTENQVTVSNYLSHQEPRWPRSVVSSTHFCTSHSLIEPVGTVYI
jgi:hypothetical protein